MEAEVPPLGKVEILGPTLASLIQRISSSPADVDGLIFGHVTLIFPSSLSDDPSTSTSSSFSASAAAADTSPTSPHLVATVTSFLCPSSSPHAALKSLHQNHHLHLLRRRCSSSSSNTHLLGWFSARRNTPLRPSMREFSVSRSLSTTTDLSFPIVSLPSSSNLTPLTLTPSLFLLLTTPLQRDQLIHTHEYRVYNFVRKPAKFEPRKIEIVNIGRDFRGHYGNFCPKSPFPALQCEVGSMMNEDRKEETLSVLKEVYKEQKELDSVAEGFDVQKLRKLMGSESVNYTSVLEEMYEKMLVKINSLARELEKSNDLVVEQENHNRMLRYKVLKGGNE